MSLNLFIIFTCIDSLLPVMQYLFFSEYISIIIKGIRICRDHMSYCVPMYHRNKKISKTKLLLAPFVYDSKMLYVSIIGMKIFLRQIYCLFLLFLMKYKYHRNENISRTEFLACSFLLLWSICIIGMKIFLRQNLLLVPF